LRFDCRGERAVVAAYCAGCHECPVFGLCMHTYLGNGCLHEHMLSYAAIASVLTAACLRLAGLAAR
jgi:hypothetical protein